ncbi:MAG: cache domain-containing protein [Deferribacterales bacterium]
MFISLRTKVVLSFFLLVIVPILLGAYAITEQVHSTELEQLNIIHTQMTKRIATELENYVKHNAEILKQRTTSYVIDYSDKTKIERSLSALVISNNNLDQIIFLDKDGYEVSHVHRYKILSIEEHDDYSKKIVYIYPKLNKSLYFGDIRFADETGEPVAEISFDVRDPQTNHIIGVVIATLRLKPIWNMLANINVQKGQQIYILDSNGRLIAHPNPSMVLKNITYNITGEQFTKGITGDYAYLKYTKVNVGNQFFTVVSEHNTKEALKLLNNITLVIIIVVTCVVVMCILLLYLGMKHLVKPINNLSKVAKEIEHGNLESFAEAYNNDELGLLADSFNKMTHKLKENTIQLKEFNLGLQKKISSEIEKTRKMEQMLFEQKKFADMGQMINAIAHQWRQPLNNIGLIQQYLSEGFRNKSITEEEFESYSKSLMEIVSNMSSTIDDFRTFFTSNKQKDRFNVINALKEFMRLTTPQLNSSNIRYVIRCYVCSNKHVFDVENLSNECDCPSMEIVGHAGEFKQVMQNIVSNAKDEFVENGTESPMITISISLDESSVTISFKDNAGGIPENVLPNIFDPYFTTKEEGKGTGIGLYISKVIIDEHFGGRLRAVNVEGGAEFSISVPRAPKA